MTTYLPICLNLRGRPVVVIGGGAVGTQKVRDFLEAGACVTVISPEVTEELEAAAQAGTIRLVARAYRPGDCAGAFLVAVATSDPAANVAAFAEADGAGVLVNVCDDPAHCNYIFASTVRRGPLTLAIFTHGMAPVLARRVRRELEAWLGPEYAALAELVAEVRSRLRAVPGLTQPQRQRILERLVYSEALLLFREQREDEARTLAARTVEEELAALDRQTG